MEPNESRQECSLWVPSLCLWLCHTFISALVFIRVLTCESKSKDSFRVFSFSPSCKCALVYSSACYSCGLIKSFYPKMSGETNSRTSSVSRTRSKWCNPQNMSSMQLLLCSTLEYHTLLYQEVVPSLMTFLMKWCSYTSCPPFLWAFRAWNVGYANWCGHLRFLAILIALKPKEICVILSMIG
jgi:hypothetical protein